MKRFAMFGGYSDIPGGPPPDPTPDNDWKYLRGSKDTGKEAWVALNAANPPYAWKDVIDTWTGLSAP